MLQTKGSNEKLRWGTNDDVFTAFSQKSSVSIRSKNVAYFANVQCVNSYDQTIAVWDEDKAIVLHSNPKSQVTNNHISGVHRALNYDYIGVSLDTSGYGHWGEFPKEEYWHSVVNPNCKATTFSEIDINSCGEDVSLWKNAVGEYGNWNFDVSKENGKWKFEIFGEKYELPKLSHFRDVCRIYDYIFDKNHNEVMEFIVANGHEHCERVVDFVDGMKAYIKQLCTGEIDEESLNTKPLVENPYDAKALKTHFRILIGNKNEPESEFIPGLVVNDFGVHRDIDGYNISHLETGLSVYSGFNNKTNALIIARELEVFLEKYDLTAETREINSDDILALRTRCNDLKALKLPLAGYKTGGKYIGCKKN
jgi:hypothetical protein